MCTCSAEHALEHLVECATTCRTPSEAFNQGCIDAYLAGAGVGGLAEHERNRHSGSGAGSGSNTGYGSNTGSGSNTGYGSNTGSGSNTGYGSGSNTGYGSGSNTTGAGVKSHIPGTEQHRETHGSGTGYGSGQRQHYGAEGTDSFGNPQAPLRGDAALNPDGVPVGTGNTSIRPGQTVSTSTSHHSTTVSSGRPSAYDSPANQGSRASGGGISSHIPGTQAHRETHGTGRGSDNNSGRNTGSDYIPGRNTGSGTDYNSGPGAGSSTGGSLASVVPGTQAYRDARVRQGDDFEGAGIGSGRRDNNYYEGANRSNTGTGHHGHHHGHHGHHGAGTGTAMHSC